MDVFHYTILVWERENFVPDHTDHVNKGLSRDLYDGQIF